MSGYAVRVLQAGMIGYDLSEEYDVIYSCRSLQFLPLAERRKHFDKYKRQTKPGGLNAHLVFVEKPFIKLAPDWEKNNFFINRVIWPDSIMIGKFCGARKQSLTATQREFRIATR